MSKENSGLEKELWERSHREVAVGFGARCGLRSVSCGEGKATGELDIRRGRMTKFMS